MRNLSHERFGDMVEAIHVASLETERWNDFLKQLSDAFGSARTALHSRDYRARYNVGILGYGFDREFVESYDSEYGAISPWAEAQARERIGKAQTSETLVDRARLRKTRFYHEWVRPQDDAGTGAGITIARNSHRILRLSCNIRFRDEDRYRRDLVTALDWLGPHLQRAFSVNRQLRAVGSGAGLSTVLHGLPCAVMLVDAEGRIRFENGTAEKLHRKNDVLTRTSDGRLAFHDAHANRVLGKALLDIRNRDYIHFTGSFQARSADGRASFDVSVAPLGRESEAVIGFLDWSPDGEPAAMVCLHADIEVPKPDRDVLRQKFGLTPAELELAFALYDGGTLQGHAQNRKTSINTVRKQLGAVFEKTGCSQQSQLVALMARCVA